MGNYKTIAAVSRTIAHVLREALVRLGLDGEVDVTIVSPHQANSDRNKQRKTINLFLYHVRPTASVCNLDLYYLLSFYGTKPNDVEAERLLGLTVATLNAHPLLDQRDFVDSAAPNETSAGIVDAVAVTPMTLTIEEMQRLWMMFPQVPYALSMSYCASSVLIISDGVAEPALPGTES